MSSKSSSFIWSVIPHYFLVITFCPFLLHVATNPVCTFLVSRQLVRLSSLPKFLYFLCGQKVCIALSAIGLSLNWFNSAHVFVSLYKISFNVERFKISTAILMKVHVYALLSGKELRTFRNSIMHLPSGFSTFLLSA
jgi:hypothetical protein